MNRIAAQAEEIVMNKMIYTNSVLKSNIKSLSPRNAFDHIIGQHTDRFTKAIYDIIQRVEYFISESHRTDLFPNLLYGIHFRCIWRYGKELYILRAFQRL